MNLDETLAQLIHRMVDRALAERLNQLALDEYSAASEIKPEQRASNDSYSVKAPEIHVPIPQSKSTAAQAPINRDFHTVSEVRQLIKSNIETLINQLGVAPFTPRTLAQQLALNTELRIRDRRSIENNETFFTRTVIDAVKLKDWASCPFIHIPPQNSGTYTFSPELLQAYKPELTLNILNEPTEECKISITAAGYHSTRSLKSLLIELLPTLRSMYGQNEITIAALAFIAAKNTSLTDLDNDQVRNKGITRFHARIGALVADRFWAENPFYKIRWGVYGLREEESEQNLLEEHEIATPEPYTAIHIDEDGYPSRHSASDVRRLIRSNLKYIVKHLGAKPFFIKDFISLLSLYADLTPMDKEPVPSSGNQSRFYVTAYSCLKQTHWAETPVVPIAHGLYRLRRELLSLDVDNSKI